MKIIKPEKGSVRRFLSPMFVVAFSMLGVTLISFFSLIHQSLRLDESQSIWQASHSFSGVIHTIALDVHVPLYHVLLHIWITFFGDGVITVRLLSLFFFLGTIPLVYVSAKEVLSRKWAMFAVVLFSFSPFMNWYANEARMYTLLVFVAVLHQLFFIKAMKYNKFWLSFAVTAVIGVYSHYFFFFILLSEGIFFLVNRKRFPKKSFTKMAYTAVIVFLAFMPWLHYFRSLGSASGTRPNLQQPSTVDFFNVYSQFLFGFQVDTLNTILLSAWPIIMLIALLAVRKGKEAPLAVSFIASMALLPVLLAYGVSLIITPFFVSRYMIAAVAPLLLFLLWLFSNSKTQQVSRSVATLLIAITFLGTFSQITHSQTPVKENYQEVVNEINKDVQPQDLVVISAPYTIYPIEYYYKGSAQIQTLPNWDRVSGGSIPAFDETKLPEEVAKQNENHRYIYLILSQDQGYEETIRQYYLKNFKQVKQKIYSDDLALYVYQVGYYTVPPLEVSQKN